MTGSTSAWQPAISYSLTGALVLVVTSSTPPDSAVHQTLHKLTRARLHEDLRLAALTSTIVC